MPKEDGKRRKSRERTVEAHLEGSREDIQENRKVGDSRDSAGRAARSDTSRENVDGESPTSSRKMQTAEKKSGAQPESEEDGEVGRV